MEKIMNVSEIKRDNPTKYGKYARYKIDVEYLKEGKLQKREDYLDEKQAEKDVDSYSNNLKVARSNIHLKYFKKRVIYNAIMALLCAGEFLTILGIGNLLIATGINELFVSILANISIPASVGASLWYVNQRKFYYSNNEIELLDKIKQELLKCDDISSEIYKMKQEGKTFEYDYQRLNKDYEATRERNRERNIQMQLAMQKKIKEVNKRIENGVQEQVEEMKKNSHHVKNIDFDYFENSFKNHKTLQKNSTLKDIKRDLEEIILEERNKKEQAKYSDNSFQRGEKRRR